MQTAVIFRGSPRKNGNTNALTDVVAEQLRSKGWSVREFELYDMHIEPCLACRQCQQDWNTVNCAREDDMAQIFDAVERSQLLILATPVYSWYCTPPMKAMLDRLVYAMNMYYGVGGQQSGGDPDGTAGGGDYSRQQSGGAPNETAGDEDRRSQDRRSQRGPSLWQGKRVALITTCGYPPEKGADLLEEGIRRYCKHSQLRYEGMLCARHMGYDTVFMDEEKQRLACAFAGKLISE